MKLFSKFTVILFASLIFIYAMPALANDGPSIAGTWNLGSLRESDIVMKEEIVKFTIPALTGPVFSQATFWFTNPTDKDITVPTIFPVDAQGPAGGGIVDDYKEKYAQKIKVYIDGVSTAYTLKPGNYIVYDGQKSRFDSNPEPSQMDGESALGAHFDVTVPAKATTKVEINFISPLSQRNGISFFYYFASGAGWKGPIGKATFQVVYPIPLKPEYFTVDMKGAKTSIAGNTLSVVRENFEPTREDGSIYFDFLYPSQAKNIADAVAKVKEHPDYWDLWKNLAIAYKQTLSTFGPASYELPQQIKQAYWDAAVKAFAPSNSDADLAALYSNYWSLEYNYDFGEISNCPMVNLGAYNAVIKPYLSTTSTKTDSTGMNLLEKDRAWVLYGPYKMELQRMRQEEGLPLVAGNNNGALQTITQLNQSVIQNVETQKQESIKTQNPISKLTLLIGGLIILIVGGAGGFALNWFIKRPQIDKLP